MPPLIRQDDLLLRLIKDVNDIQQALRRVVANLPLYDISNENTPVQITSDQNNYVPGNFDVLRISSDASGRAFTGFRGGVKGRFLHLFNIGNYEIIIKHLSVLSLLGNRVKSPTGLDIIVNAGGELILYYDITTLQWIASYASNADRISVWLYLTAVQSIPNAAYTPISWSAVYKDTGGFFNPLSPTIVTIPETGWYEISGTVLYKVDPNGLRETHIILSAPSFMGLADSRVAVVGSTTYVCLERKVYLAKGATISVEVWQNSGGPLDVRTGAYKSTTGLAVTKM